MAHFAELDENSIVKRVLVVSNHVIADSDGNDVYLCPHTGSL